MYSSYILKSKGASIGYQYKGQGNLGYSLNYQ